MGAMRIFCMRIDSDSCHGDIFFNRKDPYHFSLSKGIPQKTNYIKEYLVWSMTQKNLRTMTPPHLIPPPPSGLIAIKDSMFFVRLTLDNEGGVLFSLDELVKLIHGH